MRAISLSPEEQFRLITECRRSGLSDHQWSLEQEVNTGTFYNWISRLKRKGNVKIPAAVSKKNPQQEIVKS